MVTRLIAFILACSVVFTAQAAFFPAPCTGSAACCEEAVEVETCPLCPAPEQERDRGHGKPHDCCRALVPVLFPADEQTTLPVVGVVEPIIIRPVVFSSRTEAPLVPPPKVA